MSWSRVFTGTPSDVIVAAVAVAPDIKSSIPEFEREQVDAAIAAGDRLVLALPSDATVSLSLSGHGYRQSDGSQSGSMSAALSYSLPAPAAA